MSELPDISPKKQEMLIMWADRVIDVWQKTMVELGAIWTYQLADSLYYNVIMAADGDQEKISFFYNYYGIFVDVGISPSGFRTAKMWYSKTFLLEVRKLTNIMAERYAHEGAIRMTEHIRESNFKWKRKTILQ